MSFSRFFIPCWHLHIYYIYNMLLQIYIGCGKANLTAVITITGRKCMLISQHTRAHTSCAPKQMFNCRYERRTQWCFPSYISAFASEYRNNVLNFKKLSQYFRRNICKKDAFYTLSNWSLTNAHHYNKARAWIALFTNLLVRQPVVIKQQRHNYNGTRLLSPL
jgi:hypothetical protein